MKLLLNIGNPNYSLKVLTRIKENVYAPFDVKITNSHIRNLNKHIGYEAFKKETLYVSSKTLWEIMRPIGGKGKHHYHGLAPQDILSALSEIKNSNDVRISYDGRYVVITLAKTEFGIPIAIILTPHGNIIGDTNTDVARIITIYPFNKK